MTAARSFVANCLIWLLTLAIPAAADHFVMAAYTAVEVGGNASDVAGCASGDPLSCTALAINALTPGNFADEVADVATVGRVADDVQAGVTVEVFEPGANISPNSLLDRYPSIGRDGSFVTGVGSIERVTGPIPDGATEIRITRQQADQLETDLGLSPGSLESSNTLSIVSDVQGRCPRCPVSGNDHFLGGGQGLPGEGSELVIDSIPSAGGDGIRQITVIVEWLKSGSSKAVWCHVPIANRN